MINVSTFLENHVDFLMLRTTSRGIGQHHFSSFLVTILVAILGRIACKYGKKLLPVTTVSAWRAD